MDQTFLHAFIKYCPTCESIRAKIKKATEVALRQCYAAGKEGPSVTKCRNEVHSQYLARMAGYHRRCPTVCERAKATYNRLSQAAQDKCDALPAGSSEREE